MPHAAPTQAQHPGLLGESWRAWTALLVGVLAVSAHSAFAFSMSVLMKPILADLGLSRTEFAGAMTFRLALMVLAFPFAGWLTDRFGPRLVLAGGALVFGCGILGMTRIQSVAHLYAVSAFIAPAQACIGSVAASALVLRLFRHRQGVAIGVLNGGDNLINSAVPLFAAFFLVRWGWRVTLETLAVIYLILAAFIFWSLRAGEGRTEMGVAAATAAHTKVRLRDLPWADRGLWILLLAYAGVYAFITSVQLHFHAFQTDLGRTPAEASQLNSILILIGAVGAPFFGWVAERTSARTALAFVVAGLTASSFVLWSATSYAALAGWAVFYGTVNAGVVAVLALVLAELFGRDQIGRLMGVAMVVCMSATMLGNLFSASIFDGFGSYVPAWRSFTVLMLLTLVPVEVLRRRKLVH